MSTRTLEVLIVEDNPGDVLLISEMLEYSGLSVNTSNAVNGQKALDMLSKRREVPGVPTFDLVFLDLNLPIVRGLDVLAFMKRVPGLQNIPVVVLTGSLDYKDEQRSRDLGALDYWIKPSNLSEMEALGMRIKVGLGPLIGDRATRSGSAQSTHGRVRDYDHQMVMRANGMPHLQGHRAAIEMFNDRSRDLW
jgi:chemotaxis family two-component system response regulator Rcp1